MSGTPKNYGGEVWKDPSRWDGRTLLDYCRGGIFFPESVSEEPYLVITQILYGEGTPEDFSEKMMEAMRRGVSEIKTDSITDKRATYNLINLAGETLDGKDLEEALKISENFPDSTYLGMSKKNLIEFYGREHILDILRGEEISYLVAGQNTEPYELLAHEIDKKLGEKQFQQVKENLFSSTKMLRESDGDPKFLYNLIAFAGHTLPQDRYREFVSQLTNQFNLEDYRYRGFNLDELARFFERPASENKKIEEQ